MLDLIPSLSSWPPAVAGERYAVATVVAATGSVPRPVGTSMLVAESGAVLGSLSGGCVEGAVVALALEAMDDGGTRHGTFGYSAADAFAAGLTCGGELGIHIEPAGRQPALREALGQLATVRPGEPVALVRRLDAGGSGAVVIPDPATFSVAGSPEAAALLGLAGHRGRWTTPARRSSSRSSAAAATGRCLPTVASAGHVRRRTRHPPRGNPARPAPHAGVRRQRLRRRPGAGRQTAGLPGDPGGRPPRLRRPGPLRLRRRRGHGLAAPVPRSRGRRGPARPAHRRLRPDPRSQVRHPAAGNRAGPGPCLRGRHGVAPQPPPAGG